MEIVRGGERSKAGNKQKLQVDNDHKKKSTGIKLQKNAKVTKKVK